MLELWLRLIDHHRALSPGYPTLSGIVSVIGNEIRRAGSSRDCRLWVADSGGHLVGFLFAEIESGHGPNGESPPGWIHEIYVDPEQRERGVAGLLIAEADAFFAARGAVRVSVRVESNNAEALDFWARRGFGERARILERVS